jgi:FMN phosphatase YigB (HAD superfamily)
VGVCKPDPLIFSAALNALRVTPMESLYVDDEAAEADGARALGFTSFFLDRSGKNTGRWTISSLRQLTAFVEKQAANY